jgi:rod shape-determining protein MreC
MTTLTLRQTVALVALFVAASAAFVALDNRRALDPVKTVLLDVVQPVARGLREMTDGSESDLERELAEVRAERDALKAENVQLQDLANEAEQLQAQLDVQEDHPDWEMVTANVISPDPASYQKYVTIDKGYADGIRVGMAVVDPYYLVGIVTEVEEHAARVTLAIDAIQPFTVGARIVPRDDESTGGDGIAYGAWQQGGRIVLRHVDRDLKPTPGDYVVTAPADSEAKTALVPPDLVIGEVIGEPVQDLQSDSLIIEVAPYCEFDLLKVVTIILTDGT